MNRFLVGGLHSDRKRCNTSPIFSFFDYWFCVTYNLYKKYFERSTFLFLKNEVHSGAIVVDVGAGFGVYSKLFLQLVGEKGKVISYEPDLLNYQRCVRALARERNYSNLDLYQIGVSQHPGHSNLIIDQFNPANHRIDNETQNGVEIETVSLDSHLSDVIERIQFCKIDVQGHEIEVLRGGIQLLGSESCCFMIEFDANFGLEKLNVLWTFMLGQGYVAFQIEKNGKLVEFILNDSFRGYRDIIFKKESLMFAQGLGAHDSR